MDGALQVVNTQKFKSMSIDELDNYGSDIQQVMTDTSKDILSKANMMDLGETKESLNELYDISKKHKKLMLPIIGKPINKIRQLASNYSKVQERIDEITIAVDEQQSRMDTHVKYMQDQILNLQDILVGIRNCEDELTVYSQELQTDNIEDKLRLQVVSSRLRTINGTRVVCEQAQAEALMILAEQREAKTQLEAVVKNAIPAIHVQAVNSIGIRVTKETQEIIDKTRDIAGNILVQNASDVKRMAEQLQKNRTKSIVDDNKLMKAQSILEDAIKAVTEASQFEADNNIRLVKEIQEKTQSNQEAIDRLRNKVSVGE